MMCDPNRPAGTGGGLTAKDALGNDVRQSAWVKSHQPGDHSLVQGLKSDPSYLIGELLPARTDPVWATYCSLSHG